MPRLWVSQLDAGVPNSSPVARSHWTMDDFSDRSLAANDTKLDRFPFAKVAGTEDGTCAGVVSDSRRRRAKLVECLVVLTRRHTHARQWSPDVSDRLELQLMDRRRSKMSRFINRRK